VGLVAGGAWQGAAVAAGGALGSLLLAAWLARRARAAQPVDTGARLAELRRLGQAGHLRGIEAALKSLAEDVPASAPLVEQLRGHVRAFDLGGYMRVLDAHG
jgi:hypothetical protein